MKLNWNWIEIELSSSLAQVLATRSSSVSYYENNDDNADKSRFSNEDPSSDAGKESLVPNKLAEAPPQTAKVSFFREMHKHKYTNTTSLLKQLRCLFVSHQMSLFTCHLWSIRLRQKRWVWIIFTFTCHLPIVFNHSNWIFAIYQLLPVIFFTANINFPHNLFPKISTIPISRSTGPTLAQELHQEKPLIASRWQTGNIFGS